MQRITTQMTAQMTLADLTGAYERMSATQEQLSSGKRINRPSDDPYGTSRAIELNGELSALDGYQSSVNDGSGWTQASDNSLMSVNNLLQRVRELVVQGQNETNNAADRLDIASEVDQLTDGVKQEANSTYAGQYIFAGTATTAAPYQNGSTDTYGGDTGTIAREIGPGASVQVNTDISGLLGNGQAAGDGKALNVLRDISQHLRGGTAADIQALGSDLKNLDTNLDTLSQMQANVGATEGRLSLASSRIQDLQSSQTKLLSNTQDADMAKTIIDYTTEQSAYTAALRASANIVQSSLMDFLK